MISTVDTNRCSEAGLTEREVATLREIHGPNVVNAPFHPRLFQRVASQLADPLVVLLVLAGLVTTAVGDWSDTVIIAVVVLVNTTIGVAQQVRAERAIDALRKLASPAATVIRNGIERVVAAADLVPNDLITLRAGDVIPADARLTEAIGLDINEAALTGESLPVTRLPTDEIAAGTVVTSGRGRGIVLRTGANCALGAITALVASTKATPTPLQRRLVQLGRMLGVIVVGFAAVIALVGLVQGRATLDVAITAVSLVVAAVPESLPAVVVLALALGAHRMAAQSAIARDLHAVETLGSITIFASDKTGTLTTGRLAVRHAVSAGADDLLLARAGCLCNDASWANGHDSEPSGDPLELALLRYAMELGVDPAFERRMWPRVAERPFDADRRRMTTVHQRASRFWTVCKGAPEEILHPERLAEHPDVIAAARDTATTLATEGLRVIAIAHAVSEHRPSVSEVASGRAEHGLRLLGLIALGDPLRPGARELVQSLDKAGVSLVLITGDHPATAAAIGGELGIWHPGDPVATGEDVGSGKTPPSTRVYARISPEQKLGIVSDLKANGHVVAMTGDGVNDAPALRRADIGVAMGASGTDVAKQAADLVLADDSLQTLPMAIKEGRRIYANIRRFLRYGLAGGFAELLIMLVGPFLGMTVPLLPGQILWVNLLTHGLPGVALGAEPVEGDVMTQPPRSPQQSVLGAGLLRFVVTIGAVLATVVLAVGWLVFTHNGPWRSMMFVVLGMGQLSVALALRTRGHGKRHHGAFLLAAVALSGALQLAAVSVPALAAFLHTETLTWAEVAGCVAIGATVGAIAWLYRWFERHRWCARRP